MYVSCRSCDKKPQSKSATVHNWNYKWRRSRNPRCVLEFLWLDRSPARETSLVCNRTRDRNKRRHLPWYSDAASPTFPMPVYHTPTSNWKRNIKPRRSVRGETDESVPSRNSDTLGITFTPQVFGLDAQNYKSTTKNCVYAFIRFIELCVRLILFNRSTLFVIQLYFHPQNYPYMDRIALQHLSPGTAAITHKLYTWLWPRTGRHP